MVYDLAINHPNTLDMKVGINGWKITDLKKFFYAFATLPSQKDLSKFTSNALPVIRTRKLSGGVYWGVPSKVNIAKSMKEIFASNFQTSFRKGVVSSLEGQVADIPKKYSYFKIM